MANHLMLVEGKHTLVVVYGVKKATEAFYIVQERFGEEAWSLGSYGCTPDSLAALRAEVNFEAEQHGYNLFSMNWEGTVRAGLHTED